MKVLLNMKCGKVAEEAGIAVECVKKGDEIVCVHVMTDNRSDGF